MDFWLFGVLFMGKLSKLLSDVEDLDVRIRVMPCETKCYPYPESLTLAVNVVSPVVVFLGADRVCVIQSDGFLSTVRAWGQPPA